MLQKRQTTTGKGEKAHREAVNYEMQIVTFLSCKYSSVVLPGSEKQKINTVPPDVRRKDCNKGETLVPSGPGEGPGNVGAFSALACLMELDVAVEGKAPGEESSKLDNGHFGPCAGQPAPTHHACNPFPTAYTKA